jgi:NAD(P)-dependent dehydrogenase (short-subunit alcohol dehydrogenase family)
MSRPVGQQAEDERDDPAARAARAAVVDVGGSWMNDLSRHTVVSGLVDPQHPPGRRLDEDGGHSGHPPTVHQGAPGPSRPYGRRSRPMILRRDDGRVEDVVGPAVWPASDAPDFVNGQVIHIDVGITAVH